VRRSAPTGAARDAADVVLSVHDRAEQPLARRHERAHSGVGEEAVELALRLRGRRAVRAAEHEHRRGLPDPEWPQPRRQLLVR
jgi:hypothetical protein